jgi:hypothetical protein
MKRAPLTGADSHWSDRISTKTVHNSVDTSVRAPQKPGRAQREDGLAQKRGTDFFLQLRDLREAIGFYNDVATQRRWAAETTWIRFGGARHRATVAAERHPTAGWI